MGKNQIQRKIFQPDDLTEKIINRYTSKYKIGVSEFINECILDYYRPKQEFLFIESNNIFELLEREYDFSETYLKETLSRVVGYLAKYPIDDYCPLENIMIHFRKYQGTHCCYDYYDRILDESTDHLLRKYKAFLVDVDSNYSFEARDLGTTSRFIFNNWEKVRQYADTYRILSIIINAEDTYIPFDEFDTLLFIRRIGDAITRSTITEALDLPPIKEISLKEKIDILKCEIHVYYSNTAYIYLTGDTHFEHVPTEIRKLWDKLHLPELDSYMYEDREEYYRVLKAFERECRKAFTDLKYHFNIK